MKKIYGLLILLILSGHAATEQLPAPSPKESISSEVSLCSQKINSKGYFRGLVILAEFSDTPFTIPYPAQCFREMLNTEGYNYQGAHGSARDYFITNSNSLFLPEFNVIGPIKLSKPMSYYGQNAESGEEIHAAEMITELCKLASSETDFSTFDSNNDGMVDMIYVFFASYSENENQTHKEYIWSHAGNITDSCLILHGKTISRYACSSEYTGKDTEDEKQMATIGTFCHEFSHVLGLPDFYNTLSGSGLTPGSMSILDKGNYLDKGRCPAGYSAFEKEYIGWLEVPILEESNSVTLVPLNGYEKGSTEMCAFKIVIPDTKEYYYFENRQAEGWDAFLPGTGLLIYHVDKSDEKSWDRNEVNTNYSHPNYQLIRSGGKYAHYPDIPFPGEKNKTSFTPPVLWNGKKADFELQDIRLQNGNIKFNLIFDILSRLKPLRFGNPQD